MTKNLTLLPLVATFALSFAVAIAQEAVQENGDTPQPPATSAVQEERLTVENNDKETPAMKGLKPERAFQRRVPSGYGTLVSAVQREQIYKIQADYYELIALLELRLELLKKERDAKIEGVLTPAQLEQIQRPVRRTVLSRQNQ